MHVQHVHRCSPLDAMVQDQRQPIKTMRMHILPRVKETLGQRYGGVCRNTTMELMLSQPLPIPSVEVARQWSHMASQISFALLHS